MASDENILKDLAYRIARVVIFTMFATVPVHFIFHRWEASDVIAGLADVLFLIVLVLSIIAFRFVPLAWALLAVLLHALCVFA